ncbi:MAG: DUF2383 domain-containing protein [Bacillota bacterium]
MGEKSADKSTVDAVLSKVLEQERSIMRIYNSSLSQIDDKNIKELLTAFKEDHKLIIEKIKARMRSFGIDPKTKLGLLEGLDSLVMNCASFIGLDPNDNSVVNKIYKSEAHVIQKIKEVEIEGLDTVTQHLIERIITINNNNLKQLKDLLNNTK